MCIIKHIRNIISNNSFSAIHLAAFDIKFSHLTILHFTESILLAIVDYLGEEIHFTSLKDMRL